MKFKKLVPPYTWLPLITVLAFNCLVYFGTRIFTQSLFHHDIALKWDHMLPFVPVFITFYILAYVQWIIGYIVIARESKEVCYEVLTGEMIAKACCLACFVVYPTTLVRPEITGDGLWNSLVNLVYEMDAADNLFPSIHCLESWVCFRGAFYLKKMPGWYKWVMFVFSMGVFASTVLVKQHVIVDMIGAIVVAELGLFLARKWNTGRLFELLESCRKQRGQQA